MEYIKCSHCKTTEGSFIKYSKGKTGKQYFYCIKCNTKRAKKYRATETGKQNIFKAVYKSIKKYRYKQNARLRVRDAILAGKIKKPLKCINCNNIKPLQAHHLDYKNGLNIEWLCSDCHSEKHKLLQFS